MCVTTTKQIGLVQFNLVQIVLCSGVYHFIQIIPTTTTAAAAATATATATTTTTTTSTTTTTVVFGVK